MSLFLTRQELRRLTGTADKREQVQWLAKERIAHRINMAGQIVVTRAAIDAPAQSKGWAPDFSSLGA
jgi:hypothetical protein